MSFSLPTASEKDLGIKSKLLSPKLKRDQEKKEAELKKQREEAQAKAKKKFEQEKRKKEFHQCNDEEQKRLKLLMNSRLLEPSGLYSKMTEILGTEVKNHMNIALVMQGLLKYEMMEIVNDAKEIKGDDGPLEPEHIREAYRQKKWKLNRKKRGLR